MYYRAGLTACLILLLAGCSRQSREAPRLAIVRFENLSADPSLDWIGRAFSEILCGELEGAPQPSVIEWRGLHAFDVSTGKRPAAAPGISAERTEALLAGANEILYGDFSVVNGRLRVTASLEDTVTRKTINTFTASGPVRDGIFPVADALARQLGPVHPFGTRNLAALRSYVAALDSGDPAAGLQGFAASAAADPDFGRAYVLWLDTALARRDPAEAAKAFEQARVRMARFSPLDRARLNLGAALLSGDFNARVQALTDIARLDPDDPNSHRALAESLMSLRQYDGAIAEFRRTLALHPDDVLSLNSMGYSAAYSGDLPTAIRALRGYEKLRPNDPNPLDSLGDAHFVLGRYKEAEQFYLAARAKSPAFLNGGEFLKAAHARLMTGDLKGATELFNRFLSERREAHDPFVEIHAAAWRWQTGSRRQAIQELSDLAARSESVSLPEAASRTNAQAALWLLELGDRAAAAERARKSMAEAGPQTAGIAAVTVLLTQPEAGAAEWESRAGAAFPHPADAAQRDYALAYALLFAKQFPEAARVLKRIYDRPTSDPDDGLGVLLGWAYEESGRWQEAEPLLRVNPLPQAGGLPMFQSLYFPRVFYLRGALLEKQGRRDQAIPNYRLFLALAGNEPDIWRERERAAAAAGQAH